MTVQEIRKKVFDTLNGRKPGQLISLSPVKLRDGSTFKGILTGHQLQLIRDGKVEMLSFIENGDSIRNVPIEEVEDF